MRFIFSSITAFFKKITPSRPANSKFWPPGATFSSWNRNFKVPKCCLDGRQVFSTWFLGRCGGGVMSGVLILLNCFLGIIHWLGVYCCSNIIYSSRPNWQHNFLYSCDFLKRNKTQHSLLYYFDMMVTSAGWNSFSLVQNSDKCFGYPEGWLRWISKSSWLRLSCSPKYVLHLKTGVASCPFCS